MDKEILTPEMKKTLLSTFKLLESDVRLAVFTKKGVNDLYNDVLTSLIKEISSLDIRLKPEFHIIGGDASRKYGVERSPTLLIEPDRYKIRFTGAPLGEEGRALVMAILTASTGVTSLSDESKKRLGRLQDKRHIMIFTSPSCPYCPQQVMYAVSAAIERKDLVSMEAIEIYENKDIADKYSAQSVPKTFIDGNLTSSGLEPEEYFMESVVKGIHIDYALPIDRETLKDYDIAILGGGPAGLTAAIYAERSGLKSVVFERANIGGQVAITPVVENYPGFPMIAGKTLVELMAQQAMSYATVLQGVDVSDIEKTEQGFKITTSRGFYNSRAIIIATGASHMTLGVQGEKWLSGRGVSYCATCDGYFYKDGRHVLVVGGGNTALTDALYLDSLGAHVTLIHRRDEFRAEDRLVQSVFQRNIEVKYSTVIDEIIGETLVKKARLKDLKTDNSYTVGCDAVFVAIGYTPNSDIGAKLGLDMDGTGYIKTDASLRTSQKGIYAAGDVTGGIKQITVAVGQGSIAAMTAFEDVGIRVNSTPV